MSTLFTILWIGWIVAFFVVEGIALHCDLPGDTLSEHLRKWFSVKTAFGRSIFLFLFGGFAIWFIFHIIDPVSPIPQIVTTW